MPHTSPHTTSRRPHQKSQDGADSEGRGFSEAPLIGFDCYNQSVRRRARAHVVPIFHQKPQISANLHKRENPHFQRVSLMAKNLLD